MGRKRLGKVVSVYKLTAGTILNEAMTAGSPADGESLSVEQVTDFDPDGGTAVIGSETLAYDSIDESTDELVGIVRGFDGTTAASHSVGAFVQESTDPTDEKWARVKLDDEEEIREIPVPAYLYPLLRLGTYSDEEAPSIPVYYDEDEDEVIVMDGPLGAVPTFDEDLEVLPPVGGGDSSSTTTDPDTGKILPPKGMGYEDGEAPSEGVEPTVTGGVSTLFITWPTIANNSIVKYKVHVSDTTGFTPDETTLVGTLDLAGTAGFTGSLHVHDFPDDHFLTGSPLYDTTYYVVVIPSDGSGEFEGPHTEASGTPIRVDTADIIAGAIEADLIAAGAITATKIEDGAISTPKLAAGAVTAVKITAGAITANEIASGTITGDRIAGNTITGSLIAATTITGTNIAGNTITAAKLSVSSLSAITADLGTVTAGSITGVTITGGTIRTSSGTTRVEMTAGLVDRIRWVVSGSTAGDLLASGGGLQFANLTSLLIDSPVDILSGPCYLQMRAQNEPATGTNAIRIYWDNTNNQLRARFPSGSLRSFNTTAV